jgi:hypothetical protein
MKEKIPGAPVYLKGVEKGSAVYKEWAAEYARAKRAYLSKRNAYQPAFSSQIIAATLELLLDIARNYRSDEPKIKIPAWLWPSFATALSKCGYAATIEELDLLRRVVSE